MIAESAVLQMNVGDYFTQGRRGWVRLHEKGGKEHEAPCHHKLETFLDEYITAAGIVGDKDRPLFRTTGVPRRMMQKDAYKVIERRRRQADSGWMGLIPRVGGSRPPRIVFGRFASYFFVLC